MRAGQALPFRVHHQHRCVCQGNPLETCLSRARVKDRLKILQGDGVGKHLVAQPAPFEPPLEFRPPDYSHIVGTYDIKVTAEPTDVEVEGPITLRQAWRDGGRIYLVAWSHNQKEARAFQASRIRELVDLASGERADDPIAWLEQHITSPLVVCGELEMIIDVAATHQQHARSADGELAQSGRHLLAESACG